MSIFPDEMRKTLRDLRAIYERHIETIGETFRDFCGDVTSFKCALNLDWPNAITEYEKILINKEEKFKKVEQLREATKQASP